MAKSKECKDHLGNVYSSIDDMCDVYKIGKVTYLARIRSGWSIELALTKPVNVLRQQRQHEYRKNGIQDHLGNKYNSRLEMCSFYGISLKAYERRRERGLSLKDALTLPYTPNNCRGLRDKQVCDHKGIVYSSKLQMCNAYGIKVKTFDKRIRLGFPLERALTEPLQYAQILAKEKATTNKNITKPIDTLAPKEKSKKKCKTKTRANKSINTKIEKSINDKFVCYDHLGIKYNSVTEMCQHYSIPRQTFKNRIGWGWETEKALTTPSRKIKNLTFKKTEVVDYLGNTFSCVQDLCDKYNITPKAYYGRISRGWSMEDVCLTPMNYRDTECFDHLGNIFSSRKEMCDFYNISIKLFESRQYKKWTLEEILTIPKNMYIGEYRVAECLKRLNVKFYHDCSIKTVFKDLAFDINWNEFLDVLHRNLGNAGINWSKSKIQRLRPDFVLYTDNDNKICGVIEFDGAQHQNFVEYFFRTVEEFLYRSETDFAKQSLWEYLNIPMLRIRDDQSDMIDDMVKDFIDNPQNYIHNHNTYLSEDEYWSILSEEKAKLELAFAS